MKFKIRYKKPEQWFWKSSKVIGFKCEEANRMIFYHEGGGVTEIPDWNQYMCKLGNDWVEATRKAMEKESGQSIKLETQGA